MTRRDNDTEPIVFDATPTEIAGTTIVRFPAEASARLPSRGQVAAEVTVDGHRVAGIVEPDGAKGHWVKVGSTVAAGGAVPVTVSLMREWPEPDVPADLARELADAPAEIRAMWEDITPMARWEWVRWVNATANAATRQRRVEVAISKMSAGKRRPCCFDLSACTDPALSRSGRLIGTPSGRTRRAP